jgi:OFA family oxalate/formate antiporter-like MFS transporter
MQRSRQLWNPRFPFDPEKWPIFYGWMILAMSAFTMICSIPGQTMGVGVFTDTFIEVLGISRMQLTFAYLAGTVGGALLIARAGRLFDVLGARKYVVIAASLFGSALLFMSQMDRVVALFGGFGGTILVSIIAAIGFFGIRMFGQGMVPLGSSSMMAKWWNQRRGTMTAIGGLFVAFGFAIAPRVLDWEIQLMTWRGALMANALIIGVGLASLGWLFYRDNPEELGLKMDGGWKPKNRRENPDTILHKEFTREEAMRTYPFWILTLILAFHSMFNTAYTFHVIDLARSFAVPKETMLNFFIYSSFISITMNFIVGYVADRTRLRFVITFMALSGALFCAGILQLPSKAGMIILVTAMGCIWGAFPIANNVGFARYFGRSHIGAITGASMSWVVFGSAVGPLLFSVYKNYLGGYESAVIAGMAAYSLFAISGIFVENPSRKAEA